MSDFQNLLQWSQSMQHPQSFTQPQSLYSPSLLGTARDIQTYLDQQKSQQNSSYRQVAPLADATQAAPVNDSPGLPLASPSNSTAQSPQAAVARAQAAIPQLLSQNGAAGKGGGHGGSITGAMKNIASLLG